jgi:hypothetical protein
MARTSMSNLISLVRDLIGDPAGEEQTFTDDQIERSLEVHRWEYRYLTLKPLPTVISGNTEYRDWYSDEQYWEADATLYDGNYNVLTPTSSNPLHGQWSFSTHQTAVLASGKIYDPYGAAADLLEMWASKVALEYDVDADGTRMNRSQKREALQSLATQYRRQQRIVVATQERGDVW